MKTIYKIKLFLIITLSMLVVSCGSGSLTELANNNLYAYKAANKTAVPDTAENEYKDIEFQFNDGEQDLYVHGWAYTKSKSAPTVIYLHGNATNIGSLNNSGILNALKAFNTNIVVIDYPGYGKSKGQPTMKSLTTSAGEAIKWANTNYNGSIYIWGRSLGTGVTAQAVKKYGHLFDAYVLTSPWSTVEDLIKHHFNSLAKQVPEEWLEANKFETTLALENSTKPGLIFHGDKDTVIPYKFGQKLYDKIKNKDKVKFNTLKDFEHNDIFRSTEMWDSINSFVN